MKRLTSRRLSPATVISCIALFVSLSGASYGVATGFIDTREIEDETIRSKDVRNNSIRTQDIRNNEVRGRDIRNSTVSSSDVGLNSLTGSDILESSLTGLVATDTTGFVAIPLGAGAALADGEPSPQVDVDPFGYAHLEGMVRSAGTADPLAVVPAGARPAAIKRFVVFNDTVAYTPIAVQPNGDILPTTAPSANDRVSLDGVTYRVGG